MSNKPLAKAELSQPFASARFEGDETPTIDFTIVTTPGFSTGATVNVATAKALIEKLQAALAAIEDGAQPGTVI